jgi:hypothetical protein
MSRVPTSNTNLYRPWGSCANPVTLKFEDVGALVSPRFRNLRMLKGLGSFTGSHPVDVPRPLQLN